MEAQSASGEIEVGLPAAAIRSGGASPPWAAQAAQAAPPQGLGSRVQPQFGQYLIDFLQVPDGDFAVVAGDG